MNDKGVEGGFEFYPQLFNLASDKAERKNVAENNPEIVQSLQAEIDRIRSKKTRE